MPVYEYECRNCGIRFEHMQHMRDDSLTLCPECHTNALFRVIQPVGVIFKGSGFYVTDNRGRNSTGPAVSSKTEGTKDKAEGATSMSDNGPRTESPTSTDGKSQAETPPPPPPPQS